MIIKPIGSLDTFNQVLNESKEQGFNLVAPNSVILDKEGRIVGGVTMVSAPLVWTNPKMVKVRESLQLYDTLESMASTAGARLMCFPIGKSCPYFPHIGKKGFLNVGSYDLFMKTINPV